MTSFVVVDSSLSIKQSNSMLINAATVASLVGHPQSLVSYGLVAFITIYSLLAH